MLCRGQVLQCQWGGLTAGRHAFVVGVARHTGQGNQEHQARLKLTASIGAKQRRAHVVKGGAHMLPEALQLCCSHAVCLGQHRQHWHLLQCSSHPTQLKQGGRLRSSYAKDSLSSNSIHTIPIGQDGRGAEGRREARLLQKSNNSAVKFTLSLLLQAILLLHPVSTSRHQPQIRLQLPAWTASLVACTASGLLKSPEQHCRLKA